MVSADLPPRSRSRVRFANRLDPACVSSAGNPLLTNVLYFPTSFTMGPAGTHSLDSSHRVSIFSAEQLSAPHLAFCVFHCHCRGYVAVSLSPLSSECQKYTHRCNFTRVHDVDTTRRSRAAHYTRYDGVRSPRYMTLSKDGISIFGEHAWSWSASVVSY